MLFPIRKLFYALLFNLSLFSLLMIGIQNSSDKRRVDFKIIETVTLPLSFIIGVSFISGSLTGSFLTLNSAIKK